MVLQSILENFYYSSGPSPPPLYVFKYNNSESSTCDSVSIEFSPGFGLKTDILQLDGHFKTYDLKSKKKDFSDPNYIKILRGFQVVVVSAETVIP